MTHRIAVPGARHCSQAQPPAMRSTFPRGAGIPAVPAAVRHGLLAACIGVALWGGHITASWAQTMVSAKSNTLNMRAGPGTNHPVLWQLDKGFPLRVVSRKGSWLKVRDFENDSGWVARSLTGKSPHHIVKAKTANIRSGPGTNFRIIGKASYGDLLRTLEKRGKWARVVRSNGGKGWVSRGLLWGW